MASNATPQVAGAAQADPKHYTIEAENDRVRVLRARYGPGEKSNMHSHPPLVAIMLTPGTIRMHGPDGSTMEMETKAGEVMSMDAQVHCPENIGSQPFEVILVELK